jgi:adenosylcobyric acid synthase
MYDRKDGVESECKFIMFVGTTSHAGKSVLTAAFCKILKDMGYKVTPFKAQNMSLNSYVTKEGKEIAIAQAVQAMACEEEPTEYMNPILIKPKGDSTAQIMVYGAPYKDIQARDYYKETQTLWNVVTKSIKKLSEEYDIVVIEGAGNPAEINLYDRDITNMAVARFTGAKTYLVGDIERGGVFASLYGTYMLIPEEDRKLIKGFIINKFRGDVRLLDSGISALETMTGVRVYGVLPYLDFDLPSEDSLALEEKKGRSRKKGGDIAILRLPRISNFTDFEKLEKYTDVRYVDLNEDLDSYSIVIIPGTKNTVADLIELKKHGMDKKLKKIAGRIPIIGICGGYQMLSRVIVDRGIELGKGDIEIEGLGLIDGVSIFDKYEKTTVQVERKVTGDCVILDRIKGEKVKGYEIHMGITKASNPIFENEGSCSEDGMVFGTYMHGLFLNDNVIRAVLEYLGKKADIRKKDDGIEKLVSEVKQHIDVDQILMDLGLI